MRNGNRDVAMLDAHDAHAGIKYQMRSHHQAQLSGGHPANHDSSQEASSTAQRFSPMETLSSSSSCSAKLGHVNQFSSQSQRQSSTRQSDYSPSSYFPGHQQQKGQQLLLMSPNASVPRQDAYTRSSVPNLDDSYGDLKSRHCPVLPGARSRGSIPEFRELRYPSDLQPKINAQPPFRRANPEGGFISVCLFI